MRRFVNDAARFFIVDRRGYYLSTPIDGGNYVFEVGEDGHFIGFIPATDVLQEYDNVREVFITESGDGWSFVIDNETITCDGNNISPDVVSYYFAETSEGNYFAPVSLTFMAGMAKKDEDVYENMPAIPVVVDSEGNKYLIKNTQGTSKYYGYIAVKNVPGGDGAWWSQVAEDVVVDGVDGICLTGDWGYNSFLKWLYSKGLDSQIMYDYD